MRFLAFLLALFSFVGTAHASVYSDSLSEFSYDGGPSFPSPEQTVGTFVFGVPSAETIVSATLDGTFGNSVASSSAPFQIFLDSIFVGECVVNTACFYGGLTPFSFSVSDLSIFDDGEAVLSIIQTGEAITRLGATTLSLETRTSEVPLPAGFALLGSALVLAGAFTRRRRI